MGWTVASGVDTHKDSHSASALSRLGCGLGTLEIPANSEGYRRLIEWARSLGEPAFAVEGTGSYGAGLLATLVAAGALNELQALRLTAPPALRAKLAGRTGRQLARHLLGSDDLEPTVLLGTLRRLATRVDQLSTEITTIDAELGRITAELAPDLLAEHGFGSFTVAQTLVSSGDPRRLHNKDASLARLGGTCPIPASSGQTTRHRLNRSGDRRLNRAIHVIALTRIRSHQETRAYYQRLQARGKSKREAIRCVKRALTRRIYKLIGENPKPHYADT